MTITDEPGVPFHRLARNQAHRWWRPVLGTLVVLGSSVVAMVAVYAGADVIGSIARRPLNADGTSDWGGTAGFGLGLLGTAMLIPCVLFAAWWVQRRRPGTVSSVQGRLRLRWLGVCALVAVPTIVLLLAGMSLLYALTGDDGAEESGAWVGAGPFTAALLMLLVLVPLQSAGEEYLCRGWLLQATGAYVRSPWLPLAVQAVAFTAIHGDGTPWGYADLILYSVAIGWLTVRTGGLEAAIALHVVNNLASMAGAAAFGELNSSGSAADAGWQFLAADALLLPVYVATITWLSRRRRLVTLAPAPDAPELSGPALQPA
ncbi:CPBP family intramembrane glutamic endopeptidase [Dactylosporangium sp. NPDC000521]|uniref:CPBP family intramembrane glutamic endopeptidase n=1 Tax=Dactylosporangium sp. NPDC000521 TaxID=3363975 RepID=UPI0036A5E2B7